jgi:two-component system phosphate regulon sensor histidine kinase PhoR
MKLTSVKQVAIIAGICSAAIGFGIMLLVRLYSSIVESLWFIIATPLLFFMFSFLLVLWAIDRFVYEKIKVIYRILQGRGSETASDRPLLDDVQKQAENWTENRQREIKTLKKLADFRRDFVGNLAHELRTPIFSIQGYLDTLLEGGLEDSKINYDYLSRADKNLQRLTILVNELNEISNMEAGREKMNIIKVNIVELVSDVFSLLELRANRNDIKLTFSKKYDKPIWVNVDRDKILQVLTNLIMNSIHYGAKKGECKFRFSDMPKHILVEVQDDGIGIDEEHLPRLFERFYRVDKSRSRHDGGTGLGLAIVKHIIESHGQTINVRSAIGEGTTFSFTLPKA